MAASPGFHFDIENEGTYIIQHRNELKEALSSASAALIFSSRDQSLDHRDAWVYGILVGWDEALLEVSTKFGWDDGTIERLKSYRTTVEKFM